MYTIIFTLLNSAIEGAKIRKAHGIESVVLRRMACPLLPIHPKNPEPRKITQVAEVLSRGGIIIYPTDTVYGIGCNLINRKAVDRLVQIVNVRPHKFQLSFICCEISQVAQFVPPLSSMAFKLLKQTLPGPFTYILTAGSLVPKIMGVNKKTVGIRLPDHPVPRELVRALGHPLVSASVKDSDPMKEYTTDPEEIYAAFKNKVDLVIDSGLSGNGSPVIIRQGLGQFPV
jgi:tRNA threonylcarbamoyl adenosine modification protein (Sua5/YciO/YrdC/YwlC family)